MLRVIICLLILLLGQCPGSGHAAVYHVSGAGNDTYCTGLSGANWNGVSTPGLPCAWRTISKVNSSVSGTGDDVYFRCGDTWTSSGSSDYLSVDWNGTESDPVTIGAYYLDGGSPVYSSNGSRPILDGNDVAPSGTYSGIIYISSKNHITIQDLDIYRSHAVGVYATYSTNYLTVQRCLVRNCYGSGIIINTYSPDYSSNFLIDSNEVRYCAHKGSVGSVPWGTGIGVSNNGVSNGIIRNNTVHNMYGEGIDILFAAHGVDVYSNTVYATRSVGIYAGQGIYDVKIFRNLVYGTSNSTFWNSPENSVRAPCISVLDEPLPTPAPAHSLENVLVWDNAMVGCGMGLYLGAGDATNSTMKNLRVYNNTLIDNYSPVGNNGNIRIGGTNTAGYLATNYFTNNLSWCITSGCVHYSGISSDSDNVFDYNLWAGGTPPAGERSGAHDQTSAPTLTKTSGFRDISDGGLTWNDLKLTTGSSGVDVGSTIGSPYDYDAFGTTRPQPTNGAWDIGAHELWEPPVADSPGKATSSTSGTGSVTFGAAGTGKFGL